MVNGTFKGNVPLIQVLLAWSTAVQNETFILDTGFTGDLQVTEDMAKNLGLIVTGVQPTRIADGSVVNVQTANVLAFMEGQVRLVTVLISKGSPLAGINFLRKFSYKTSVCCKTNVIELEMVP